MKLMSIVFRGIALSNKFLVISLEKEIDGHDFFFTNSELKPNGNSQNPVL